MTKVLLTQVQASEMGFLRRVYGVTQGVPGLYGAGKKKVWRPYFLT